MKRFALTLALVAGVALSQASSLPLTFFSNAHQQSYLFNGFGRDRSTGRFYKTAHYVGQDLTSYGNLSDFANDTAGSTVGLGDFRYGTYGVVRNGKYFMRSGSNPNGTQVARFDATTGMVEAYGNFSGYGGVNGPDTFDWGGYSAFNMFDDPSGLFMIGRDLAGNQRVTKIDNNFNILSSAIIGDYPNDSPLGFAFNVRGQLFVGDDFYVPTINRRIDLATGNMTSVNINLTGITNFPYISHAWYDDLADRLYVTSAGTGSNVAQETYYLDGAASALEVVPEPGSILAIGAGLASVLLRRRRK